ncbi:MAG: isoprenylcysteine carboxylmethyltransferase family protein [Gammaproteobacteria bacterium]|nr:isoprenylcysteine carboxylmethyltransferase family protein [Gammaproteobacteria bacterium]
MSNRTRDLPAMSGLPAIIRELRHHEFSRQGLALVFLGLFAYVGMPWSFTWFVIGASLAVIGQLIRLWASGHVKKNKILATDGPYAFVRHPLYVGNIVVLIGLAIASGVWWTFPLLVWFFWFYYPTAISYEDNKLGRLFGSQWAEWRARTHALLPRYIPENQGASSAWSFKQSLIGNGEPIIVAYLLGCLLWLYLKIPV